MIEKNANRIKLLDESVYNKIAAGEVVGRPASVVKELVENSLDAGAKNISVVIKDAGKKLIQVSDDGIGMSEDDVKLSVKRHATSKISDAEDLERIGTFGFRGEALSSIAAVSELTIKTNDDENNLGSILISQGESEFILEKEALPQGTTVIVKNLFYNVPARKNFLKSDKTEFAKIVEVFNMLALAHPEIAFKLYKDNSLYLNYQPGGLDEKMKQIFDENILDMTIAFEESSDFLSAFGYVAKPTYLVNSKNSQFLFVNGRYVKNKVVNNAVFAAYENLLAKGEYPFFVFFLNIDAEMVDVNVHPTKEEIKFYNDSQIYSFVKAVVKKALGSYDFIPKIKKDEENELKVIVNNAKKSKQIRKENITYSGNPIGEDELDLLFGEIESKSGSSKNAHPFAQNGGSQKNASAESKTKFEKPQVFFVGEKFLASQIKSGLLLIDINRAHQRILRDKAMNSLKKGASFSQQLLFSRTFQLSREDYETAQKFDSKLSLLGFELKYHSKNTITVAGVPSDVKMGNEVTVLSGIISALKNFGEGNVDKIIAETFAQLVAYKSAKDFSANEETLFVDQLFATTEPKFTPNGKRIFITITYEEIMRRLNERQEK